LGRGGGESWLRQSPRIVPGCTILIPYLFVLWFIQKVIKSICRFRNQIGDLEMYSAELKIICVIHPAQMAVSHSKLLAVPSRTLYT